MEILGAGVCVLGWAGLSKVDRFVDTRRRRRFGRQILSGVRASLLCQENIGAVISLHMRI